jgi:hypothetical protein
VSGGSGVEGLGERLREAAEEELAGLIEHFAAALEPQAARQAFRNPFLTAALIERLCEVPHLLGSYEVRREAAFHPRTPRVLALRFVPGLWWADLVRLGTDTRLHPVVRRAGELRLIERLPGLAVGERMAVARAASPGVIAALRQDGTPRVIQALLENPRLTEGLLMPMIASETSQPKALATVAASPRWVSRPPVRAALCRNPATPMPTALALLPMLGKRDQAAVAADPRLPLLLRRKAQLLSGSDVGPPPV